MFKRFCCAMLFVVFIMPSVASAWWGASDRCETTYPIVFAHGFAAKEGMLGFLDYFYNVEEAIEAEGGTTFTPTINAMDNIENKAISFKNQVEEYMLLTGAEKVNIIGHSHGGIYTRYAITMLGMADKVASLTTIDSVHRGSSGPDIVLEMCDAVNTITFSEDGTTENIVGDVIDVIYGNILGDENPNSEDNCVEMSTTYMEEIFNPIVIDSPDVYYQSYAGVIKYISPSNSWATLLWPAIGLREGANDGCVSAYSAEWGNYRGKLKGAWWGNGVDHIKVIGQPFGITPGFDAPSFYAGVVEELKDSGF